MTRWLCLSLLVSSLATPTPASAQMTVEEERGVQIAAMSTGYAFGALHTGLSVLALAQGQPLDRSWVAGSFMSSITFVSLSIFGWAPAKATANGLRTVRRRHREV